MIFSDMSAGTNSPKVHPPNGTRFYTFQVSMLLLLLLPRCERKIKIKNEMMLPAFMQESDWLRAVCERDRWVGSCGRKKKKIKTKEGVM